MNSVSIFLGLYPPLIFLAAVTAVCFGAWSLQFTQAERKERRTQWYLITGIAIAFAALGFEEAFWYHLRMSEYPFVTPLLSRAQAHSRLNYAIVTMLFLMLGALIHIYAFAQAVATSLWIARFWTMLAVLVAVLFFGFSQYAFHFDAGLPP